MEETIRWTHLKPGQIAEALLEKYQQKASTTVIIKLLKKHGFRRRKAQKKTTMGNPANRNEQFEKIALLRKEYEDAGNPVISMDTKKKELLGNFYRDGHLYTQETIHVNDHDFKSSSDGVIIPHALYDLNHNHGYIHLGTSKDTTEFACDSIRHWWLDFGNSLYPEATSILILCDGGGSNSSRYYIFKEDLQNLVEELGIEIRMAHYPPYCSKYNPIEHRLFPHITRACEGVVFRSIALVRDLISGTKTAKGLSVTVSVFDKIYKTGRTASDSFRENMPIIFDAILPKWNYCAVPTLENMTVN